MIRPALMIALLAACFLAMALSLALEIRDRNRIMRAAAVVTGVIGTALYGYGYAWRYGVNAVSVLRALLALCRMFTGSSDLPAIQDAPLFQSGLVLAVFWIGHFLGFYVMASAVIATLGDWLLRRIRVTRMRRGPLLLVYGINANAIAYARRMAADRRRGVLLVDPDGGTGFDGAVKAFGGIVEKSGVALEPSARFLRRLNLSPGGRRLEVAALHADGQKNLAYSLALMRALGEAGIRPEQATLLIAGVGEASNALQAPEGGYGSVLAFDDYELTARLVAQTLPPCDMIGFDGKGRAVENLHVVIVGFGRMGRALFDQWLVNGQFHGSRFRADIFDPDPQNGYLHGRAALQDCDIRFHGENGASDGFYSFLEAHRGGIRAIALCTGSARRNAELASDLEAWFRRYDRSPAIIQASRGAFVCVDGEGRRAHSGNLYGSGLLDIPRMDAMARAIHEMYASGGGASARPWEACDYAGRMSSRASADFYPALLRASGRTAEQVLAGDWPPDPETLENLAITEHLRWCAYTVHTGYAPMPEAVYAQRLAEWARLSAQGKEPGFAPGKDPRRRLHACLVPWEALDALSERESAVTGRRVDYKQLDRNNVLTLARVLAAARTGSEGEMHGSIRV